MSVTATSNPVTASVLQVLTDYDLHHSGSPGNPSPAPSPNIRSYPSTSNPRDWPTNHRAVPPYRPVDRNLDREQRPGGLNGAEVVFIYIMLNGVKMNAMANTAWRATLGKFNDKWWRYEIGGEW